MIDFIIGVAAMLCLVPIGALIIIGFLMFMDTMIGSVVFLIISIILFIIGVIIGCCEVKDFGKDIRKQIKNKINKNK